MREIKYRGICLDTLKFVYGSAYVYDGNAVIIRKLGNNAMQHTAVDPKSISEFTGLFDSVKKEIYEHDQLYVCAGYTSWVEFQDGMFVSVYKHPEDGETLPLIDVIGKETVAITDET